MIIKDLSDIRRKRKALRYAKETSSASKTREYFGTTRETYCQWKQTYQKKREKRAYEIVSHALVISS